MKSKLACIISKRQKVIIGILSGTSVDAVDAVLVKISGSGENTEINVIDFLSMKIKNHIRDLVLRISERKTSRVDDICRMNIILGGVFSDAVLKLLKKNNLKPTDIDLIGSHGQTIHHLPLNEFVNGYKVKATFQIGDPSVIANITGITTVGDFRVADCAVGGDGAPLVPYLDYILFRNSRENIGILNIGGIANITVIPSGCSKNDVIAFDTGPGNMLIDAVAGKLFDKSYDRAARLACKGSVNTDFFSYLLEDKFYQLNPPKSAGREIYGESFISRVIGKYGSLSKYDIIRTVTEFTAYSVWYNYSNFISGNYKIEELIVSGGGSKNPLIMKALKNYFKNVNVTLLNHNGITSRNREAVLFAVLANECISGNSANMPLVTGAGRNVILGKICQAA